MRQIILDTETTGLETKEGHRIIEIGCVELMNRKFTGKRFHQYINPDREIDSEAVAVHGITNHFLKDKPKFNEIMEDFINFVTGAELIIHNAAFDVGFLNYELMLANKKSKPLTSICKIIDTLLIARQLHVGQKNSLDALCKRYGIDHSHRELHGALLDAHLLAQVYLSMTGGQGSLFDELQEEEKTLNQTTQVSPLSIPIHILEVIKASPDELKVHRAQLDKMKEKGRCLWLEEEMS